MQIGVECLAAQKFHIKDKAFLLRQDVMVLGVSNYFMFNHSSWQSNCTFRMAYKCRRSPLGPGEKKL